MKKMGVRGGDESVFTCAPENIIIAVELAESANWDFPLLSLDAN